MNPYSHIVVASKLEALVKPENPEEYYWGTIAPDIRYLANLPREQTHIPSRRIIEFIAQYPDLRSFLQGYLVHCLSDEIHLGEIFFQQFPFSLLRSKLSYPHIAVILELFYFEYEKVDVHISGKHNRVLTELGLHTSASAKLSHSIRQYVAASPAETRLPELFRLLGPKDNSRIEKYIKAAVSFQKNWFLKTILFSGIRAGKISETIVSEATAFLSTLQSEI